MIKMIVCLLLSSLFPASLPAQQKDSLRTEAISSGKEYNSFELKAHAQTEPFPYKKMVIPALFIAYGSIALENDGLLSLDNSINEKVWTENPHAPNHFDDYLQYVPALSVYGLNVMGIKGKNSFRDRTALYLLSSSLMAITVQATKRITRLPRPSGEGYNAFPSGHTATAFVGAEFLHQEYKDQSPWYGMAGYAMAAMVGYMRIYNNRHWFRDIVAGAGIGMGITKLVYWAYPSVKKAFFRDKSVHTLIMPYYQNGSSGIALFYTFNK